LIPFSNPTVTLSAITTGLFERYIRKKFMIHQLSHPLAKSFLNHLRSSDTDALRFRHIVAELSRLLVYEAFETFSLKEKIIDTWQGEEQFCFIAEAEFVFVPILRAGLPMLEGIGAIFPAAPSGFLAMKRDEVTHQPTLYYDRVPDCRGKNVILLDPMVATGGSLCDAIRLIKQKSPRRIVSLNIIGSPEGLSVVEQKHPDIDLYIAQIDKSLDPEMFILPGLGDAGDRSFNTTGNSL